MASVAAMVAISPLVSIKPTASPLPLPLLLCAISGVSSGGCVRLAHAGRRRLLLAREGQGRAEVLVRARDDLDADDLADPAGGGGAGIDRRLDRGHVADHEGRHQAAADLVP